MSTTMKSKPPRQPAIASPTRSGSRISVCSGELARATTRIPLGCSVAISRMPSAMPPSASSRQLSTTVRTCSRPSDVVTWPVTVSASTRSTFWPLWAWRATAMFVAIVVLPTPPLGLKTTTICARRPQSSRWSGLGLHDRPAAVVDGVGPDEHGLDAPAERLGRVGPGEVLVVERGLGDGRGQPVERAGRDDHEGRDRPPVLVEQGVVLERGPEVALPVEDGHRDIGARVEEGFHLVGRVDRDDLEPGPVQLRGDGAAFAQREVRRRRPDGPR